MQFINNSEEKELEVSNVLKETGLDRLAMAGIAQTGNIPPERKTSEYLKSAVGWVYACVNVIADEIASIKIKLYQMKGKEAKEVENHPALELLYHVNEFTTKFDFFSGLAQYLELTGEAPFYVSFKGGQPDKMIALRPDRLTVKQGTGGQVINGYEYEVEQGKKVPLDLDEVVFLRYPDPNKPFRGMGPLQACARTVDIDEYSEEYNKKFFFNSARPDSALETDMKLTNTQLDRLTKKFEVKYRGLDNAHKTIILQSGLKFKPISLTQKDMDFIAQMNFSRDKILGIFRVPRTVLGITDDVNRANAEATDYVFAKRTIKPKLERIVQQLNEFYLPMFRGTENMYFDYESPVPEDKTSVREWQRAGLEKGWITINEAREADGLTPLGEEADKLRLPMGMQEIESYDESEYQEPTQLSADRRNQIATRARKAEVIKTLKTELESNFKKVILDKAGYKAEPKADEPKPEVTEEEKKWLEFQGKQLNVADDYEKKFKSEFNSIFDEQAKEVIAKLDKKELNPKDFLLSSTKEKKRYVRHLSELFVAMIVAQSKEAMNFIGEEGGLTPGSSAVINYLSKRAFKFSTPVTQTTNKLLGDTLAEGIDAGEAIPKLQARVEAVFGEMKASRSETIARSETIRATNYASEETYKDSGVVEGKRWLAALDERTCEFCDEMNGEVVELGDSYVDKGDTFVGRDGGVMPVDYETVDHPPLHPDCRCTIIPIVSKSMSVPEQKQEVDKEKEILSKLDSILSDISNEKGE